ncbi:hypothetical protein HK101_001873 [Irineochytrium annulatum]|nr:hypothetical protein HK101_001873 [Irineochytrium annulatum]
MSAANVPDTSQASPVLLTTNVGSEAGVAIVFAVIAILFALFFTFQFGVRRWILGREGFARASLDANAGVAVLSDNFELILRHLITFPFNKREIMKSRGVNLLPYFFCVVLFVSFVLIGDFASSQDTHGNLQKIESAGWQQTDMLNIVKTQQAQAGFILFFIGCNGFLSCRIFEYYRTKTELRKKVAARSYKMGAGASNSAGGGAKPGAGMEAGHAPSLVGSKHGSMLPPWLMRETPSPHPTLDGDDTAEKEGAGGVSTVVTLDGEADDDANRRGTPHFRADMDSIDTHTTEAPDAETENNFDDEFQYIRRMKHILPQYNHIHLTPMNAVQVLILLVEFVQLASFPYRDLMSNKDFQKSLYLSWHGTAQTEGSNFVGGLRRIFSTFSQGLPSIDTQELSKIQFVVSWWFSLIAVLLAGAGVLLRHCISSNLLGLKQRHMRLLHGNWILVFLPLANLFYLVILGAFVQPLGCISSYTDPLWPPQPAANAEASRVSLNTARYERFLQCVPVLLHPQTYLWAPLTGYIMGYYVLTIFKTSEDPHPCLGVISFTTRSEVLNKNFSLILLLLYTLIPTADSSTARGVLATQILAIMVYFQIRIGSSYIRPVNFVRTLSFIFVLWMSIVVAFFTAPSQHGFYQLDYDSGVYASPELDPRTYHPWQRICLVILLGWLVILILYTLLYLLVIIKIEKRSALPREGIKYAETQVDEGANGISTKPLTDALQRIGGRAGVLVASGIPGGAIGAATVARGASGKALGAPPNGEAKIGTLTGGGSGSRAPSINNLSTEAAGEAAAASGTLRSNADVDTGTLRSVSDSSSVASGTFARSIAESETQSEVGSTALRPKVKGPRFRSNLNLLLSVDELVGPIGDTAKGSVPDLRISTDNIRKEAEEAAIPPRTPSPVPEAPTNDPAIPQRGPSPLPAAPFSAITAPLVPPCQPYTASSTLTPPSRRPVAGPRSLAPSVRMSADLSLTLPPPSRSGDTEAEAGLTAPRAPGRHAFLSTPRPAAAATTTDAVSSDAPGLRDGATGIVDAISASERRKGKRRSEGNVMGAGGGGGEDKSFLMFRSPGHSASNSAAGSMNSLTRRSQDLARKSIEDIWK